MENNKLTIAHLTKAYNDVWDFWKLFELPWKRTIGDLGLTGCVLSTNCIREELNEFIEADTEVDKLDAIVDLLYVSIGGMLAAGLSARYFNFITLNVNREFIATAQKVLAAFEKRPLPCVASITNYTPDLIAQVAKFGTDTWPRFWQAWDEVHGNNMAKMWTNQQVAELDPATAVRTKHVGVDMCIVWRLSDGKLMKPPGHKKPNLAQFIN